MPIGKSELVLRLRTHTYHMGCFRCTLCQRPLHPGEEVAYHHDLPYCLPDSRHCHVFGLLPLRPLPPPPPPSAPPGSSQSVTSPLPPLPTTAQPPPPPPPLPLPLPPPPQSTSGQMVHDPGPFFSSTGQFHVNSAIRAPPFDPNLLPSASNQRSLHNFLELELASFPPQCTNSGTVASTIVRRPGQSKPLKSGGDITTAKTTESPGPAASGVRMMMMMMMEDSPSTGLDREFSRDKPNPGGPMSRLQRYLTPPAIITSSEGGL
ncbi:unnamed protein product, partial [Protopolystoma xenopodis]